MNRGKILGVKGGGGGGKERGGISHKNFLVDIFSWNPTPIYPF